MLWAFLAGILFERRLYWILLSKRTLTLLVCISVGIALGCLGKSRLRRTIYMATGMAFAAIPLTGGPVPLPEVCISSTVLAVSFLVLGTLDSR